jgi:hypothetical protein
MSNKRPILELSEVVKLRGILINQYTGGSIMSDTEITPKPTTDKLISINRPKESDISPEEAKRKMLKQKEEEQRTADNNNLLSRLKLGKYKANK